MSDMLQPPWTDEQVANLNAHQQRQDCHPFTCGNDSSHVLRATPAGWICDECPKIGKEYTQNWCHGVMTKPQAIAPSPRQSEASAAAVAFESAQEADRLRAEVDRLREAMTWAAGFIDCNVPNCQQYPDYHNCMALLEKVGSLYSGPLQMALGRADLAEAEVDRLKLPPITAAGTDFRTWQRENLERFAAQATPKLIELSEARPALKEAIRLLALVRNRVAWSAPKEVSDEVATFLEKHRDYM